jgi:NAD(P)-dependent dehydrogenase (short-subunit alcohol dehydrogenase family)
MQLSDKVIVVLGGSGLIGAAVVRECITAGAQVVIADRKTPADSTLAYIECDATDEASMRSLAGTVQDRFGRADGVINATYPSDTRATSNKQFEDGDLEDMLHNASVHLRTCFLVVRAFAPLMRAQGSGAFVFFASIYGVAAPRFDIYEGLPMTQPAEYAAAKGGIIAVTRYFASLLGRDGIRVNVISPGGIVAGQAPEFIERYSEKLLLGSGLLKPEHVSGAAAFLVSDASAMMTGQNMVIDGGWTL